MKHEIANKYITFLLSISETLHTAEGKFSQQKVTKF